MAKILHLDASARVAGSVSRQMSALFIESWKKLHPEDSVIYRDIGRQPPPHMSEAWITGAYTPPETHSADAKQAMYVSDMLVDEFLSADRYVFGVPMYNFSVPSAFKAYVDQIVRIGRTFASGWEGLVEGRKMLVTTARGGSYLPGSSSHAYDHQEPWIRTIMGYIGVKDITFIHAQGMNMGDEAQKAGLEHARQQIAELAGKW
jgi:FMN-dependent NADH-azoreductase